jgi:hypothetical protein
MNPPPPRQIYEKRLIEKQIQETGQCPVTKEELHEAWWCED